MFKPYDFNSLISPALDRSLMSSLALRFDTDGLDFGATPAGRAGLPLYAPAAAALPFAALFPADPQTILAEALFSAMVDNGHVFVAGMEGCACHGHDHGLNVKDEIERLSDQIGELLEGGALQMGFQGLIDVLADLGGVDSGSVTSSLQALAAELSKPALPDANEPSGEDLPADTSTTGTITIGGSASGTRSTATDEDWYAVDLEAGVQYTFIMLRDGDNPHEDPLLILYNSAGTEIDRNDDIEIDGESPAENRNSMILFTPTESGTYYLGASGWTTTTGDYTVYAEVGNERPDFTLDQAAFFLTSQFDNEEKWDKTDLTYDISALSEGAKNLALLSMEAWAEVSNITFTAVAAGGTADITFNEENDDDDGAQAFASSTTSNGVIQSVTVTVSQNWDLNPDGSADYSLNSYRFQTYIHEVGHALGLGHSGPYNGQNVDDAGNSYHVYNQDAWNYTIMSYRDQGEAGTGTPRLVLGPQVVDIIAIQEFYGANAQTRTGDNVYGFNSTETGVLDFEGTFFAQGIRPPSISIYDAGGTDTLDFSGYSANQTISLVEGSFSSIGDNTNTLTPNDALVNNITIAVGTVIENAIGGSGDDSFIGNGADNVFTGNNGNDSYSGGAGSDTVIFAGAQESYTISVDGDTLIVASPNDGTDRINISNIELVAFEGGTKVVTMASLVGAEPPSFTNGNDNAEGTSGDDQLDAMSGDDVVNGGAGNDTIFGNNGSDTLNGDAGNDVLIGDNAFLLTGFEADIYRAYQAVFGRDPDMGGFDAYVTGLRLGNITVLDMFEDFVASQEFLDTYGNLSNAAFVDQLYANILPGNTDQVGRDSYTNSLNTGALTRAQAVAELAGSAEFQELSRIEAAAFANAVITDPVDAQVFRIYQAVFGRDPDADGFTSYTGSMQVGAIDILGIATDFVGSQEFLDTYGNLTNAEFVELLYTNVLPGNTDQAGRDSYINSLDSGALTRTEMIVELSESFEFRERMEDAATTFVRAYDAGLTSDTLNGGLGNDVMFGGDGRDQFVFEGDQTGADEILDFVPGVDVIVMDGVSGFADFNAVLAAATQVGQNTLITLANGNSILLRNLDRDSLSASDFEFGSATSAEPLNAEKADIVSVSETLESELADLSAELVLPDSVDRSTAAEADAGPLPWLPPTDQLEPDLFYDLV